MNREAGGDWRIDGLNLPPKPVPESIQKLEEKRRFGVLKPKKRLVYPGQTGARHRTDVSAFRGNERGNLENPAINFTG